jgi:type III pantothenate kinase
VLLAVDIGNTQTHLGVFKRDELVHEWRSSTEPRRTADELALLFGGFLSLADLSFSTEITGVAIASVVPRATQQLREMTWRYFGFQPVVVEPGTKTGVSVLTDNPKEVGADRITNAVAAHSLYEGDAVIIVDFGTAINFDVVTKEGNYIGGALAPGIESSATALFTATARLPRVELVAPESSIGKNTVAAIQSGIIYGAAGLVDGIISRIKSELGSDARVVATGGMADAVGAHCQSIQQTEPNLTLIGLRVIFDRNTEERIR